MFSASGLAIGTAFKFFSLFIPWVAIKMLKSSCCSVSPEGKKSTTQLALKYNSRTKTSFPAAFHGREHFNYAQSARDQRCINYLIYFSASKALAKGNLAFVFLQCYANSRGMLQSLYMISDLPKWGLLRFTVGDYNDGLCHIAAIRRGKFGLGVDGVRTGQWIRPDFSQSSNAPSEAPLLTTYNQRTGS